MPKKKSDRPEEITFSKRFVEFYNDPGFVRFLELSKPHIEVGIGIGQLLQCWEVCDRLAMASMRSETLRDEILHAVCPGCTRRNQQYLALALLAEHPDWKPEQIAREIGVNRQTLYKWPRFRAALQVTKSGTPPKQTDQQSKKKDRHRGRTGGPVGDTLHKF